MVLLYTYLSIFATVKLGSRGIREAIGFPNPRERAQGREETWCDLLEDVDVCVEVHEMLYDRWEARSRFSPIFADVQGRNREALPLHVVGWRQMRT